MTNLKVLEACHDALRRALDEAGVKNEVLRGMAIEVGLEAFKDALPDEPTREPTVEQLQRAITGAMDALSNGRTEDGARILRECFWLGDTR